MPDEIITNSIEKPVIKTAGELSDEAYDKLAVTFANTVSKDIPAIAGSKEQCVARSKLILEKQKAEDQEALRKEVDALDLTKSHIRKSNAGTADVVYEIRLFNVREPDND